MTSVEMFASGLDQARQLRRDLLESFGAEPEWLWGSDDESIIMWAAGPLGTRFMIEPVADDVPGLGVLHVFTICATVDDLDAARSSVEDLNFHTTFERWSVLNDPGMVFVKGRSDLVDWLRTPLCPRFDPDTPVTVSSGVSFVVGHADIDLPFAAVRYIVAGAIAKATAVVTNDFAAEWGVPSVVHDAEGNMRPSELWNRIVFYLDDHITPHEGATTGRLAGALAQAFELERQLQFETSPEAWFGSADSAGFTCEVPYGPGPYPLGVIGMRGTAPHLDGQHNATSLVRGLPEPNPYVGNGLLLVVSSGGPESVDTVPDWSLPHLLNAQNRLRDLDASPGFAHAVGAWIKPNSADISYVSFIPAAWQFLLDHEDLVRFFRVMLANSARLSWGSRKVLEPFRDRDLEDPTNANPLSGLAAGKFARGPQFGELGVGQDPGAQALKFIWDNLVGVDTEYAARFNDIAGFKFWMGPAIVDVTSHPCNCSDGPGSVIVIESAIGTDTLELRAALDVLQQQSQPFGIVLDGDQLIALAQVHIHHDTLEVSSLWCVPLIVAVALFADHLPPASERGVDLRMQDGSVRPARDEMLGGPEGLGLWDEFSEWQASGRAQFHEVGLLHALLLGVDPGFRAWRTDSGLSVSRTFGLQTADDEWEALTLKGSHGYVEHPVYGRCLRIETHLLSETHIDAYSVCQDFNREGVTLLGGFMQHETGGLNLITLYPLALDRSSNYAGQLSFTGTAIQHHNTIVYYALLWNEPLTGFHADAEEIAAGLRDLVSTYRTIGNTVDSLDVTVGPWEGGVTVQWMRPWPYSGVDTSPRLATEIVIREETWIGGQVETDPTLIDLFPFRVVHAMLAMSSPPNQKFSVDGVLFSELTHIPSQTDIEAMYRRAEHYYEFIIEDEDGDFLITDENAKPIAQLIFEVRDNHQAWGRSLDIFGRMVVPAEINRGDPHAVHPLVIGAWSDGADTLEYRISLPPAMLACLYTGYSVHQAVLCVAPIIKQVQVAARGGRAHAPE